jgi:aryl-alcohol dehydrogenase-like predicted oxidoreductase
MKYSELGQSELKVSTIGFGCMSLGPDERAGIPVIHAAIERGINFFDTADIYNNGLNEVLVGKALMGHREKIILATKVGNQPKKEGGGWDWNPRKEYIFSAVEQSLKRLATDHIDLYQLHGGTIADPIDETIEAFEMLKRQGKIRYYGISSIRPNVIREYIRRSSIVSVMMQYSLLDRRPEETCMPLLVENNIGVLVRGALAQGLLAQKAPREYLGHSTKDVKNAADAIVGLSGKRRSPAQTAILFGLSNPAVTSVVTGIRTMQQLEDAVGTVEAPVLSKEEIMLLHNASPPKTYNEHR